MRRFAPPGYSLVELLVALALTGVVAVAAAALVGEAVRVTEAAGRSLRSPSLGLAVVAMRRDVHGAVGPAHAPAAGWCHDPLELVRWDGGLVRLEEDGGDLVRTAFDATGRPAGRRVLARGLTSWWWRSPNPATVDVRLTALVHPDPGSGRSSQAARQTEVWRFAFRGWPGGRSW